MEFKLELIRYKNADVFINFSHVVHLMRFNKGSKSDKSLMVRYLHNMAECFVFNDFGNYEKMINVPNDDILEWLDEVDLTEHINTKGNLLEFKANIQ